MPSFKVELKDGSLEFVGHLEDSTEFDGLESVCSQSNALNFKPLYSFSWVGMQKLMTFLARFHKGFRLVGAAPSVARTLFLVGKDYNIAFESIDLDVVDPAGNTVQTVLFSDLVGWIKSQGEHVFLPNGKRMRGLGHLFVRNVFDDHRLPETRLPWSDTAAAEIRFWYDYVAFSRCVTEAAGFALKAALVLNEEIAHQTLGLTRRAFQAYKTLGKSDERYSFSVLSETFATVQEINDDSMGKVETALKIVDSIQNEVELLMMSDGGSYSKCVAAFAQYSSFGTILADTAAKLDSTGARLGEISFSFQVAVEWLDEMINTILPICDGKSLNSVANKLKTEVDESGDGTAIERATRIKAFIEEGIQRCMIASQQFDSVRQVMEHRSNEARLLHEQWEALEAGTQDWSVVRGQVLSEAASRAVTEIERLAVQFFFPDFETPRTAVQAPGADDGFMML